MAGQHLRTNYRLTGAVIDMASATDLTALGQLIPTGYLAYSDCCLQLFLGNGFICFEASHSTRA